MTQIKMMCFLHPLNIRVNCFQILGHKRNKTWMFYYKILVHIFSDNNEKLSTEERGMTLFLILILFLFLFVILFFSLYTTI
jgi:hypothetical protein